MGTNRRDMVAQFMRHIGAETYDAPIDRGEALSGIRMSLILEELHETHKAALAGDSVEFADGLADLAYVIIGTAVAYGLPCFDPPQEELSGSPQVPTANTAQGLLAELLPHVCLVANALTVPVTDFSRLDYSIKGLTQALEWFAASVGMPLQELFEEVQRSNMTKEPGTNIGAAKYGAGGGKGPRYMRPDIAGVLARATTKLEEVEEL